jgi:hypothetical protein
MAKKKRVGLAGISFMALAALMGGANQVNALIPNQGNYAQKINKESNALPAEAVTQVQTRKRHNQFGNSTNQYKHIQTPKENQRQKRKLWRQVPQTRKKHGK